MTLSHWSDGRLDDLVKRLDEAIDELQEDLRCVKTMATNAEQLSQANNRDLGAIAKTGDRRFTFTVGLLLVVAGWVPAIITIIGSHH